MQFGIQKIYSNFIKTHSGNMIIEFALIVPLLFLLFLGSFELVFFALLNNKMQRVAGTISHVVSLQNIDRPTLISLMESANEIALPFDFPAGGSLIVSQVRNFEETDDASNMVISWQETQGTASSRIGNPGEFPQNLPGDVTIIDNQTIIIAEAFYNYDPTFVLPFIEGRTVYKISVFIPRIGPMNNLVGEEIFPI